MNYEKFHVLSVISNPMRYDSRFNLYNVFNEDIERKGGKLWTLELATGARSHQITKPGQDNHIQLWTSSIPGELWHKENMINLGIQYITESHPDWRYLAWVDADVKFEQGALQETAERLQHWDVVQMWSDAIDLGPEDQTLHHHRSFMYCYWNDIKVPGKNKYYAGQGHPGFAWAARRESLNKLGGLIDYGILGSADRHMACALIGDVMNSVHPDVHPTYLRYLKIWEQRAERHIRRNVGYVPGTIRHMWHGKKADRGYSSRWKILVDHQYDPEADIKRDVSGLFQLTDDKPAMRDAIRKYFRARNEDSIDVA